MGSHHGPQSQSATMQLMNNNFTTHPIQTNSILLQRMKIKHHLRAWYAASHHISGKIFLAYFPYFEKLKVSL
jgi:hypothetical protein